MSAGAVFVSIARVGADLVAFEERVTQQQLDRDRAHAKEQADAAGGVPEPEDFTDRATRTPAGRLALFRVLPALGVVAGIVAMIVAIA